MRGKKPTIPIKAPTPVVASGTESPNPPAPPTPRRLPWEGAGYQPLILFSTNVSLAYRINQIFYGAKHYVWCSPILCENCHAAHDLQGASLPSSSTPLEIYDRLLKGCQGDDDENDPDQQFIDKKRSGLLIGLGEMRDRGIIDSMQHNDLVAYVGRVKRSAFLPMLYIIPTSTIDDTRLVVPEEPAHVFSMEVKIHDLQRHEFEIISRPLKPAGR